MSRANARRRWRTHLVGPAGDSFHFGSHRTAPNASLLRSYEFDEIVLGDPSWLHVEQLDRHTWWLRLGDRTCTIREKKNGTVRVRWDDEPEPAALPVDQEPPPLSVVLDEDGDAWQRGQLFWYMAGSSRGRTWRQLTDHGPLRLVHRGGDW